MNEAIDRALNAVTEILESLPVAESAGRSHLKRERTARWVASQIHKENHMSEPTEREFLEGLRPEDQTETGRMIYCTRHNCQKDPYGNLCRIAEFINSVSETRNDEECTLWIMDVLKVGRYEIDQPSPPTYNEII